MNAIAAAVNWIQAVMLGTVATTVAVIAVASVGFLMLNGRIHYRRAGEVILGCFILFGASSMAQGIATFLGSSPKGAEATAAPPPVYPVTNTQYDPYAGASPGAR